MKQKNVRKRPVCRLGSLPSSVAFCFLAVFFVLRAKEPTATSRQPLADSHSLRRSARVFKPVATPGAGTWEGTFPEDRASLLDSILHVSGVLERCQVGIEAACV